MRSAPVNRQAVPSASFYTFANSDRYQATGTLSAVFAFPYNEITAANISLTYLGNSSGTSSSQDVLGINLAQYFDDTSFGSPSLNNTGSEYFAGDFSGAYSNASIVTGHAISANDTEMMLLGPFAPPAPFSANAANQPFAYSASFPFSFEDTISFGAGSGVGATIAVTNIPEPTSPVPEPAAWILLTSGVSFLGTMRMRSRRA